MRPRRRGRRLAIVAGALAAALVAAWIGWWLYLSSAAQGAVAAWVADARARGIAVTHAPVETRGFPGTLILRLPDPAVSGEQTLPPFSWRGTEVVIAVRPWRPDDPRITVSGRQRLQLKLEPPLGVDAADSSGQVLPGNGIQRDRVTMDLDTVRAATGPEALGSARRVGITLGLPMAGAASVQLAIAATEFTVPGQPLLGPTIARASVDGEIAGTLREWSAPGLAAWRDAGGGVTLSRFALDWGALSTEGGGTLGLDGTLKPRGDVKALARGYNAVIEAAVSRDLLPAATARALRLVLDLAARRPANGPPEVDLAASLRDGWLSIGPIRVAPLPSVAP